MGNIPEFYEKIKELFILGTANRICIYSRGSFKLPNLSF
jgi:hypothetical protein